MVFRRKKNKQTINENSTGMRGRNPAGQTPGSGTASNQNPLARRFQSDDEPDTIDMDQPPRFQSESTGDTEESTTRNLADDSPLKDSWSQQGLENPPAGFLVIIKGPGRGGVSTIAHGINSIGRDSSQRVSLDHGDRRISRQKHCMVTYDALAGKFYVQPGEGSSLAYLDDEPVLAPAELASGQHIRLGDTVLRFVPLCGRDFNWDM